MNKERIFFLISIIIFSLFIGGCNKDNLVEVDKLTDDFSDQDSGWYISKRDDHVIGYEDGKYKIKALTADALQWATVPGDDLGIYYKIEADIRVSQGKAIYGFFFNYTDNQNFHIFKVAPYAKKYAVHTKFQDKWYRVIDWTKSEHIRKSDNKLKLVHNRNKIKLYANAHLLTEAKIKLDYGKNKAALAVVAPENPPATVYFDNYKYTGYHLKLDNLNKH